MRQSREFKDNNIIIVCEGTTTELNYLSDACEFAKNRKILPYSNYKLLPIIEEPIKKNGNRKDRKYLRFLMGNKDKNQYYSKIDTEANYSIYKSQPTRYLREAQLFIEEDGFLEGWAVYDKDKHTDHRGAKSLLESDTRLHVAFSSYSFEEWLLCHFECNLKQFSKSECHDKATCGIDRDNESINCHGEVCIAGYLREKKYIPDYNKTQKKLFKTYTLDSSEKIKESVLINAAWIRFMQRGKERFDCNPYTDIDFLLLKLLNDQRKFLWYNLSEEFQIDNNHIVCHVKEDLLVIENTGTQSILLRKESIKCGTAHHQFEMIPEKNIIIYPKENYSFKVDSILQLRIDLNNHSIFFQLT